MSVPSETRGAALRALAARLNSEVVDAGRSLTSLGAGGNDLSERDRALLKAMLAGSLRWHHRLDWQLEQLLDKPLKRKDKHLAALLRIGLTQLEVLRIPDHASVSATVDATSELGLARARGLVNAVLRRYLRERNELDTRALSVDVARFSHPHWLIEAIRSDWPDAFESILEANNELPPLWIRVNRAMVDRDTYLASLDAAGIAATVSAVAPDAVLIAEPRPVSELPGFEQGLVSVQDAAAQHAVELMALAPGQRVLDACAAPGGKTAHMLERCTGLGELVALDRDRDRLERVRDNLERLHLDAQLVSGDATDPDSWFSGPLFDRILIDAPCSGTGVLRRHPDIKVLRRADDLSALTARQAAMLDALWPLLNKGGQLVYATCSVLKVENLEVVAAFVDRTPDADSAPFGSRRHFQLLPGETNTDGFYYACLSKTETNDKYKVSAVDP